MNIHEILSMQVVGNFCMDLAMKKAKTVGIGWVTCTGERDYLYHNFHTMFEHVQHLSLLCGKYCVDDSCITIRSFELEKN